MTHTIPVRLEVSLVLETSVRAPDADTARAIAEELWHRHRGVLHQHGFRVLDDRLDLVSTGGEP